MLDIPCQFKKITEVISFCATTNRKEASPMEHFHRRMDPVGWVSAPKITMQRKITHSFLFHQQSPAVPSFCSGKNLSPPACSSLFYFLDLSLLAKLQMNFRRPTQLIVRLWPYRSVVNKVLTQILEL